MASQVNIQPEGRVGDASLEPGTDPRFDPRLVKALSVFGLNHNVPASSLNDSSTPDELTAGMKATAEGAGTLFSMINIELPEDASEAKIARSTHTAKGVDGNDIALHLFQKEENKGKLLPAIVYIHGGGMTYLNTLDHHFIRWLSDLAQQDVHAIAIDFRNAWTPTKHNPFPAGLNDCADGVRHLAAHRQQLGISKIILQGESGGGNLSIATALKARREGWIDEIAGVYAAVPYISGAYGRPDEWKAEHLPSLLTNNGYFLHTNSMAAMVRYYTPEAVDRENPLAWPLNATTDDMKDLPPHVISVDELDPLRDEGIAYYRKLLRAGVSAVGQVNLGIAHASGPLFRADLRDVHHAAVRSVTGFAKSL